MDRRDLFKSFGLTALAASATPDKLKGEMIGIKEHEAERVNPDDPKYWAARRHIARWALYDTLVMQAGDVLPNRLEWFNGALMDPAFRPRNYIAGQTNLNQARMLNTPCEFIAERILITNSILTNDTDREALRGQYLSMVLGCKHANGNSPLAAIMSLPHPAAPDLDGYVMKRLRMPGSVPGWNTARHTGKDDMPCFDLAQAPIHILSGLQFFVITEGGTGWHEISSPVRMQIVLDGYMAFPIQ